MYRKGYKNWIKLFPHLYLFEANNWIRTSFNMSAGVQEKGNSQLDWITMNNFLVEGIPRNFKLL